MASEAAAGRFCITSRCFMSDATTSNIWHGSKLQALKLTSRYIVVDNITTPDEHMTATTKASYFADLQRVGSTTAEHVYSLTRKQLTSLGCPLWERNAGPVSAAKNRFAGVDISGVLEASVGTHTFN
jgi:hypothetical protein